MITLEENDRVVETLRGFHNNNRLGQALDVVEEEQYVLMLIKLLPKFL